MNERGVVEAALFSAGRPVAVEEVSQSTGLAVENVRELLKGLASEYDSRGSAIEVAKVGEKWTMQIRMEYTDRARAFAPPEIPNDLLKTAALIAYHQPILQSDLFDMIGSKVYEHTQTLESMNLINKRPSGRSFELTTTRYFVEFFGLKETNREGIRRLLAEKAGVRFTPKAPPLQESPADAPPEATVPTPPTETPPRADATESGEPITGG
jgi:segregation and condensation protein B